jgi:hypothetical protein
MKAVDICLCFLESPNRQADGDTYYNKAIILHELGRYNEALVAYNKVVELSSVGYNWWV